MRNLYFVLSLVVGLVCCTSCQKDEEEKSTASNTKSTMIYRVTLSDTVLHFFNVTISYRGSDSQTHNVELQNNTWNLTENKWGDSLGMRLQFSLREGVDTAYESAAYLRDGKLDLRIVTQAKALKMDADGSLSAFHGDITPDECKLLGVHLDKIYFTGTLSKLNSRYSKKFVALK